MTKEPKPAVDPDGLYAPMEGQDLAEGEFVEQAVHRSCLTWLDTRPALKWSMGERDLQWPWVPCDRSKES